MHPKERKRLKVEAELLARFTVGDRVNVSGEQGVGTVVEYESPYSVVVRMDADGIEVQAHPMMVYKETANGQA